MPYRENGALVHRGWYGAAQEVEDQIRTDLEQLMREKRGYRVVFTGHSMGGAAAEYAATNAKAAGIPVKLITFNKPETGNPQWARYVEQTLGPANVKRIVNKNEGIANLLGRLFWYRGEKWAHPGQEIFYHGNEEEFRKVLTETKVPTTDPVPVSNILRPGSDIPEIMLDPDDAPLPTERQLAGLASKDIAVLPPGSNLGNTRFPLFRFRFAPGSFLPEIFGTSYPREHKFFGPIELGCRKVVAGVTQTVPDTSLLSKAFKWLGPVT
jgi:hypothetical protein